MGPMGSMGSNGMPSITHPSMSMSMGMPVGMHARELHDNQGFEGDYLHSVQRHSIQQSTNSSNYLINFFIFLFQMTKVSLNPECNLNLNGIGLIIKRNIETQRRVYFLRYCFLFFDGYFLCSNFNTVYSIWICDLSYCIPSTTCFKY